MKETEVKRLTNSWLQATYEWVIPEFVVEDGRLDFLAARWLDDGWRLDTLGVECKGEVIPTEVWKITSEQLRRYARCVPVLYFACSVPSEARLPDYSAVCRLAGVGLLACVKGEAAPRDFPPSSELGTRLQREAYLEQVRTPASLYIAFQDVVGTDVRRGPSWFATLGGVQWGVWIDERMDGWVFGVNIENAKASLDGLDEATFVKALRALPASVMLHATQERYFGLGRRAVLPIVGVPANDVTREALAYLRKMASIKGQAVHLDVEVPLVSATEAWDRVAYAARIRETQRLLTPVYDLLS